MHEDTFLDINPSLDLVLTRHTDVPPELVWSAWTTPELLKQWFCPKPWRLTDCRIDLRPGGQFSTVMESPEGARFPGDGCILQVVENRRLVWTSVLLAGFRPKAAIGSADGSQPIGFTAVIDLQPRGTGTVYTATAIHSDDAARTRHEAMGFATGWGTAFDQLVELMSSADRADGRGL